MFRLGRISEIHTYVPEAGNLTRLFTERGVAAHVKVFPADVPRDRVVHEGFEWCHSAGRPLNDAPQTIAAALANTDVMASVL